MNEDVKSALTFFTSHAVYAKLFNAFKRKFESYGRLGGSVSLAKYSDAELTELALFVGTTTDKFRKKKMLKLKVFEDALKETRFGSVSLLALLEAFFNEKLVSRKDIKQKLMDEEIARHDEWQLVYTELSDWFDVVFERTMDVQWILRTMREPDFEAMLKQLEKAVRMLPTDYERLPFFSQRVTGNPHAFDLHTLQGKLLLHILRVKSGEMTTTLSSTEEVNELLLKHLILRDDLSNDVSVANLIGYSNGEIHPMWQVACDMQSAWNVPLREVLKVDEVRPAVGKRLFIVENSGVFSTLLDAKEDVPLLCTHGQFKLAAWKVMDMLVSMDCELYYAGDFDPEGLVMAQRLLERYPKNCHLWKMDLLSYEASQPTQDISGRLNKLVSIKHPLLIPIAERLKQTGKAGYQEALLEQYVEDFKEG